MFIGATIEAAKEHRIMRRRDWSKAATIDRKGRRDWEGSVTLGEKEGEN